MGCHPWGHTDANTSLSPTASGPYGPACGPLSFNRTWKGLWRRGRRACYLLPLEHVSEGSHLAVLVRSEDLAQRAGGHFAVETVDVDALIFMLLTHGLVASAGQSHLPKGG